MLPLVGVHVPFSSAVGPEATTFINVQMAISLIPASRRKPRPSLKTAFRVHLTQTQTLGGASLGGEERCDINVGEDAISI